MLSDFQVDLLKKFVEREFKEANKDVQEFDFVSHLDSSLGYSENKVKIAQLLKELGIVTIEKKVERTSQKSIKEQQEREELEGLKRAEEEIEKIQEKAIEEIKKSPLNINQYFRIPRMLVKSFLNPQNKICGFLFVSEAGLGKSYQVYDIFKEKDWKKNKDFAILSGYLTPMELYMFLYKYRDVRAILFDDIAKMFDNDLSKGLLLSALWSITNHRIINYLSTSEKLASEDGNRIPSSFELNAKIIWNMNRLPTELESIKSRCYYYELNFTHKTKLKIIFELCKSQNLSMEIADYIKENTNEAYNIDFRLPIKLFGFYKTNPENWQELAKAILKPNEELLIIKEALAKCSTVNEAIQEFTNKTGLGRATFFRRKKLLIQNIFYSEDEISEAEVIKEIRKVSKSQRRIYKSKKTNIKHESQTNSNSNKRGRKNVRI